MFDEVMKLAKELYPSEIRFMTTKNTALGGFSPLTCIKSGEVGRVLDFLREEKSRVIESMLK